MTLEQADRNARNILELNKRRRQEKALRALHRSDQHGNCVHCAGEYPVQHPCETIEILDSDPPIVTEE